MMHTIKITVDQAKLGAAITAITPFAVGTIAIAAVDAIQGGADAAAPVASGRGRPSKPVEEQRLGSLVMNALATGPCTRDELMDVIKDAGFSPHSISAVGTHLTRKGLVVRSRRADGVVLFTKVESDKAQT